MAAPVAGEKRKARRPIGLSIVPPPRSRSLKPIFQLPVAEARQPNPPSGMLLQLPEVVTRKRTKSAPSICTPSKGERPSEILSPPPRRVPSQEAVTEIRIEVPHPSTPDSTPSTATLVSEAKTPLVQEVPLMPIKALLRAKMRPSSIGGHEDMFRPRRQEQIVIF